MTKRLASTLVIASLAATACLVAAEGAVGKAHLQPAQQGTFYRIDINLVTQGPLVAGVPFVVQVKGYDTHGNPYPVKASQCYLTFQNKLITQTIGTGLDTWTLLPTDLGQQGITINFPTNNGTYKSSTAVSYEGRLFGTWNASFTFGDETYNATLKLDHNESTPTIFDNVVGKVTLLGSKGSQYIEWISGKCLDGLNVNLTGTDYLTCIPWTCGQRGKYPIGPCAGHTKFNCTFKATTPLTLSGILSIPPGAVGNKPITFTLASRP